MSPASRPVPRLRESRRFGLTLAGVFFFVLLFTVLGAAFSSGHNLLYLMVCLFLGSFITMGNVAVMNLRGLKVERDEPAQVFAGIPHPVEIRVHNPRWFMDSFSLEVRELSSRSGPRLGKVFFPIIEKGKHSRRHYQLVVPERGWFDLVGLEIVTRFPFGFWERSRVTSLPQRFLAFPRVYDRWPEEPSNLAIEGDFIGNKLGTGDDLLNFRDFQPGDPIRWIHWKNSARTDRLLVSVYHRPENREVTVCLRTAYRDRKDRALAQHFEEAVSWAATAVFKLIDQGVAVGYMDENARLPPAEGDGHRVQILTHLALVEASWNTKEGGSFAADPSAPADEFIRIEATTTGVRIVSGKHRHVFEDANGDQ